MYNKIYKSMLLLCAVAIALIISISILVCYITVKTDSEKDFNIAAKYASEILGSSDELKEAVSFLQKSNPDYSYKIVSSGEKCEYIHLCKILPYDTSSSVHISISYSDMFVPLYAMIVILVLAGAFLYLLALRASSALTDSIVRPFKDMLSSKPEEIYAEIRPFTRAIKYKNEEIKRQTATAQEREIQLQMVTDTMNEGFILLDTQGNIKLINDFALKLFTTDKDNVKNQYYTKLFSDEIFETAVKKALDSNRSSAILEIGDSYYRLYCSPIMRNKISGGVIILIFDVTATYQSEKMRREFSANVSHELKTPLTSINGYAQIISNGLASTSDIPDFAGKIAKESNRLMMLIEDIIRLSNLDEGAPEEPSGEFSVKEVVEDVLSSLEEKASQRNIAISFTGKDFNVNANKTQLNELLYNICDNAIKYNKDCGSLTVTLLDNSIVIADTGIGIPPEYTDRIFERFFRVDKSHSKKVDGTGLGLSIVKHIAKKNNIDIKVESKLDVGSKFTVLFKENLH